MPHESRELPSPAPSPPPSLGSGPVHVRFALSVVAAVFYVAAMTLPLLAPAWRGLSLLFLLKQDQWLLLCSLAILALSFIRLRGQSSALAIKPYAPWILAAAILCFCFAGHSWILDGYDMSRDEQMASFDALVLEQGRLVQPLPAFWQAHVDALNTRFMLPVSHPIAWVSTYLPMNAALRAFVALICIPSLTGPLITALGVLPLWKCARLLWPQEREPAIVAVVLYAVSGQVLFAGMTSYAMPAHLTLDLFWLWLFLMRKPAADLGALAVGLVATGLHQPLFHPLFALPFLVGLLRDRAWSRIAIFGAGYAAICFFWLVWPMLIRSLVHGPNTASTALGTDYLSRLIETVSKGDSTRWADMMANLLRFAAWQPVLLLPLMAAGIVMGRRERLTGALAFSLLLPILIMAIILPYQGHGFGYRYLQGVIGPAILLSVGGWRVVTRFDASLRPLLVRTVIGGVVILLPLQATMAHAFYSPFAEIDARIRASGVDYAIVGQEDAPFARDLIINRPDLSNRPIRLLASEVTEDLVASICHASVRVGLTTDELFASWSRYLGTAPSGAGDARFARLSGTLKTAGCTTSRLGGP